jgi:hypothetical protein
LEPLAIVEIIGEHGEVKARKRFNNFPVKVGRDYLNDFIIDDPYIDLQHFEINSSENGKLAVIDLNSLNGVYLSSSKNKRNFLEVDDQVVLRVGETNVRISNSKVKLPPARQLTKYNILHTRPHIGAWHAIAAFVIFVGVYFIDAYSLNYRTGENQVLTAVVTAIVGGLLAFLPWAGSWALLGRVLVHRFRFSAHLTIVLVISSAYWVISKTVAYLQFALGSPMIGTVLEWIVAAVTIFILFSLHMFYTSRIRTVKRWLASGAITAVIVLLMGLSEYKDNLKFSSELPLETTIKPPWARVVQGVSPETLSSDMIDLREQLDLESAN